MRQLYNLGTIFYFNKTFEVYLPIFNLRILYLHSSIRLTYSFYFSALFDSSGFSAMVDKESYLEAFSFLCSRILKLYWTYLYLNHLKDITYEFILLCFRKNKYFLICLLCAKLLASNPWDVNICILL